MGTAALQFSPRVGSGVRTGQDDRIQVGRITLFPGRFRVVVGDRRVSLTPVQFRLLCQLALRPHQTFSAQELYGDQLRSSSFDVKKAIRQRVYLIRRLTGIKSEELQTIPAEGYRLCM